jgi:DNA-binding response OmpR family regulator
MCEMVPTICLVGLEEPLERVVTRQLTHEGYRIMHGDHPAAVALVQPSPSAVILDLDSLESQASPDELDGLSRGPWHGPVLLLTTDRIPRRQQRQLGGAAVLCKPFTMEQLLTQLTECLNEKSGADR